MIIALWFGWRWTEGAGAEKYLGVIATEFSDRLHMEDQGEGEFQE